MEFFLLKGSEKNVEEDRELEVSLFHLFPDPLLRCNHS